VGVTPKHAVLAAGLLAAAVAAPSVRNQFVSDDHWVIEVRPLLRHPPSVTAVLAEPYWPATFGGAFWRPAVLVSYALDYRVSEDPRWFHAMNVLWAGLSAALLALLACELAGTLVGLAAGLLFAVHPVHVEAVANVVGRAELMAAAGYAAALVCALRAERRPIYLIGVASGAGFAIASKELAATLPAAIVLVCLARGADRRFVWRPIAAAAVPIIAFYVLHQWVGAGDLSAGGIAPGLERFGVMDRSWVMLALSLQWWRLLLFPAHLSADYSPGEVLLSTDLTPAHALSAAVWVAAGWIAWRYRRRLPGIAIGLLWLIITVSPVANIVVPTELLVAERTLYLPSFGVVFALASAGVAAPWSARTRGAVLAGVLVLGAVRSVARIPVWHDDETHFQALKRDAPRSYRTLWLVGKDEFHAGRAASGERMLQEAIALAPTVTGPRLDLARFYYGAGLWQPAVRQLRAATAVNSNLVGAWILLPQALLAAGDTAGAVAAALEARRRFADEPDVAVSAAAVLTAAKRR
jgi:hypothetical protein